MTTEQITLFEDFLKHNGRYNDFYNALGDAPIELSFRSRATYIPRVAPLLVLSYGFFQNRNVGGIKEKEWRTLRDAWIHRAAEANILGSAFKGIEPCTIISAINSVFNGKQYSGSTLSSVTYTNKIAEEAQRIQDTKDAQRAKYDADTIQHYRSVLAAPAMATPDAAFPSTLTAQRAQDMAKQCTFSVEATSKRKEVIKALNVAKTDIEQFRITDTTTSLTRVVDLFSELRAIIDREFDRLTSEYNLQRQEYVKRYEARQQEIADAKQFLAEYDAAQQKAAAPQPAPAATSPASDFKEINFIEKPIVKRLLDKNEISVPSASRGKTNLNVHISKQLIKADCMYYVVGVVDGKIHLRFTKSGVNRLISSGRDSLSIGSRKVGEYLLAAFGISETGARFKLSSPEQIDDNTIDYQVLSATPNAD